MAIQPSTSAGKIHVLFVCPLAVEYQIVVETMKSRLGAPKTDRWFTLTDSNKSIHAKVIQSGIGPKKTAELASTLSDPQHRFDVIFLVGFAGALQDKFEVGRIVEPDVVIDAQTRQQIRLRSILNDASPGTLLTVSDVISTPEAKHQLYREFQSPIADMEGYSFASMCNRLGKRFHIIRVISDSQSDAIPKVVSECVDPSGDLHLFGLIRRLLIRPWLWPTMVHLARNHRIASASLSHVTKLILNKLMEEK